ncbi:hypothetical protein K474DRAFT_1659934 [Panus rudis PR-1116 ss-1]|nr:hypothetical protein K474DRAFT_1659934 [Panus rudis PR-1116 ss-1]
MASARYAPLPNPHSLPDADREMNEAFDDSDHEDDADGEHNHESTPFISHRRSQSEQRSPQPLSVSVPPGGYDFERDYDHPPPGSPPGPSAIALPNNWGNSNGQLPVSPVQPPANRPSFFRRAIGALLPQHYQRLPTDAGSSRPIGGGIENDGVFANVTAKPGSGRVVEVRADDGQVHMVPEETQKDAPPSYNEAQADAVPPYWETTVHAPLDPNADMIVEDLPTGSVLLFCSNMFISYFFNFVGFLLTYLLHTTHAAKFGSRAGLGLSLIQYGFYSRNRKGFDDLSNDEPLVYWNTTTGMLETIQPSNMNLNNTLLDPTPSQNGTDVDTLPELSGDLSSRDWLAFLFMTLGWFLFLSSLVGFFRVKRWEKSIRDSANAPPPSPEDLARDAERRRAIQQAFMMPLFDDLDENNARGTHEGGVSTAEEQAIEAEVLLARNLRAAGFI